MSALAVEEISTPEERYNWSRARNVATRCAGALQEAVKNSHLGRSWRVPFIATTLLGLRNTHTKHWPSVPGIQRPTASLKEGAKNLPVVEELSSCHPVGQNNQETYATLNVRSMNAEGKLDQLFKRH